MHTTKLFHIHKGQRELEILYFHARLRRENSGKHQIQQQKPMTKKPLQYIYIYI